MNTVLAISLYNPWAYLAAIAAKKYETRSWLTNYRGMIAIHATIISPEWATMLCEQSPFNEVLAEAGITSWRELPRGVLLATGRLVGCVRTDNIAAHISAHERAFGDWTPGRYAWELADMQLLPEPIPARGRQGLWDCTEVLYPRTGASS